MDGVFTNEELQQLKDCHGKTIAHATYYIWLNEVDPNNPLEFLNWLKLDFTDGSQLIFGTDEETGGIQITNFDYEAERAVVQKQFPGQLDILPKEMDGSALWEPARATTVTSVELIAGEEPGTYTSETMLWSFGEDHMLEIHLHHEEGLVVELYEDLEFDDELEDEALVS